MTRLHCTAGQRQNGRQMTLTRTDPEPADHSLVSRQGVKWLRDGYLWHAQDQDRAEDHPKALTWAELVADEPVDLLIVGSHGLPPTGGTSVERRRSTHRGRHA